MLPVEKNARQIIGALVEHFPLGARSEELRKQFEKDTGLNRQSFYYALRYAKQQHWFVGGGLGQSYRLNPDGCWKPKSTGELVGEPPLSRDQLEYLADARAQKIEELQHQLEHVRDWSNSSNDGANGALAHLIQIVCDDGATTRQRLRASAAVLGYQLPDPGVAEFTKRFLQSVCASANIAVDYKIEAAELLRKHEAPRVMSEIVRPNYADNAEPASPPPQPLAELLIERRAYHDRMGAELERQLAEERALSDPKQRNGDDA